MTEKLYYTNAYIKEFTATVTAVTPIENGYFTVLDKTAFFPEGGGQTGDTGVIGDARVTDVQEKGGVIYHITNIPLTVGESYICKIDFDLRFQKMQMHTAEHIVCGIIHNLYGFENVGFHLSDGIVTFDVSGYLGRRELDRVEELANRAVWDNLPVMIREYTHEELLGIKYRAKLDGEDGLRIVKIGELDTCACCAPHVNTTGEIGLIKLLDAQKHRGGTRIILVAGASALYDYRKKYESVKAISASLCAPQDEVSRAVAKSLNDIENINRERKSFEANMAKYIADIIPESEGNYVLFLPDFSPVAMRELANSLMGKTNSLIVLLSGIDGNYRFLIAQRDGDLSDTVKKAALALSGRGGGRGGMAEGSFLATKERILAYFA